MAHINNGHFGSFQGKIGAVTGVKRRGKFYIRQSIVSNKSNTKKQAMIRAQFKNVCMTLAPFAPVINIGFKNSTEPGMTAYNAGIGFNFDKVDALSHTLAAKDIVIARGSLLNVAVPVVATSGGTNIKVNWTDNSDEMIGATAEDIVYVAILEEASKRVIVAHGLRKDASIDIKAPAEFVGHILHTYIFTATEMGNKCSDSIYCGTTTLE